ncbi:Unknown protein [Striga hermonthica]|uniref:Retrotransposon gag domain-containing protein n=1 Tax=Striga hermonthica TaxID=68872 RepID=A0A9N7R0U4_STRHE|nr:Unknown protein [Striga hermonthica]
MANRRNAPVQPVAASPVAPEPDQGQRVAQFRGFHPATFNGQGDSRQVEKWLRNLDLIFEVMGFPERIKILCAQLQLTGDAGLWWTTYWAMRPGEKNNVTWERLKEIVREKYYPVHYRGRMERLFLSLEQDDRTVDEYEREFTRLGFFVPHLIDTEEMRTRRFRGGLRGEIRHTLTAMGAMPYAETVSRAQQIAKSLMVEASRVCAPVRQLVQPLALPQLAPPQQAQPQQAQRPNKRRWEGRNDRRNR